MGGEVVGDEQVGDTGAFLKLDQQVEDLELGGQIQRPTRVPHTMSFGSKASTRAMAMRWRWPPLNSRE